MSRYLLIFLKKMVSEIKRPLLWKGLDPSLRYMYNVVHYGLSSIVEYGTTNYVINCATFLCIRPSCTLGVSTYPQKEKKKPGTHHIKYHFCPMTPSCVVSQYALGSLGDSHYFLLRMLLSYDMNQVYFGSGFPKVYQCIIGIIYFRGFASFSMVNVVV